MAGNLIHHLEYKMNHNETLFYQQEYHFWSAICLETYLINESTIAYFSELTLPVFNYIYLHKGALLENLHDANRLFEQKDKPYMLVVHQDELVQVQPFIQQHNLVDDGESTAMIIQREEFLKQAEYTLDAGFHIALCNDHLMTWAQPLITAFPVDDIEDDAGEDDVAIEYTRYHQRALDKQTNMMHFVLFDNNTPVTSLTLTLNGQVARLDDIGTDVQYQRRGLATQLIKYALHVCKQQGVEQCVLEASSDGLSIYKKLGFQPIFNYRCFLPQ